jgi:hypothetical protein
MARELGRFLAGLEFTLTHGLNEEKRAALRRAVASIRRLDGQAEISIRVLPSPDLNAGLEIVAAGLVMPKEHGH